MRTLFVVALAFAVLGAAAPLASAHLTFGFDWNGDRRCDDPGETYEVPFPDDDRIRTHQPCNVLA